MDIRTALWEQRILTKTFGPRGTVHLLPTQDLPMWTGALSNMPYGQAGNYPVLLVAGVWSQRRSGRKLDLTVEPLEKLTPGQSRQLEAQVQRIAEILEGNPQMTIGDVTTGGHA